MRQGDSPAVSVETTEQKQPEDMYSGCFLRSESEDPLTHGRITSTSYLSHASLILSGSGASVTRISTWEKSNR